MRKLIALLISTALLVGCTSTTEFGEVSSAIQDSQEMQAEETQSPEPEPLPTFELSTLGVDPNLCKFEDVSEWFQSRFEWDGFTYFPNMQKAPYFLPSTGTGKLALVFLDWADMPGDDSERNYYLEQAQIMSDWFELVSEGSYSIDWKIAESWGRLPGSWKDWKRGSFGGDEERDPIANQQLLDAAVDATDADFDYSEVDYVVFAVPKSGWLTEPGDEIGDVVFYSAMHGAASSIHPNPDPSATSVDTDEGSIGNWALAGTTFQDTEGRSPAWIFWAHEMGHMFGYISHQSQPGIDGWAEGNFSYWHKNPMAAGGVFANQWTAVRAVSAWTSWVAGWLRDEQVQCVEENDVNDEVFAISSRRLLDGETKAVIIRSGPTKGLVIESREWDPNLDPVTEKAKRGFYDGIFMYFIDSSRVLADESLIPLMPNGVGEVYDPEMWPGPAVGGYDAMFQEGEAAEFEGLLIEVLSMQEGVDYVRVSRVEG